jgi:hypothetical protein
MQYLTIVNRSSKTLSGTWDGRHYDIKPGKHEFPEAMAIKFQQQNPLMGSENPYTLQKQYLISIVEYNEDLSPLEQSGAIELWDRKLMPANKQNVEVVQADGLYSPHRDAAPALPLDGGSNFAKP